MMVSAIAMLQKRLDSINTHIEVLKRIEVITTELSSIDALEADASASKADVSKFMQERQGQFNELKAKREKLREQMTIMKCY